MSKKYQFKTEPKRLNLGAFFDLKLKLTYSNIMKISKSLKIKALKRAFYLRSGIYFAESLPIQILENYVVNGKIGIAKPPIDEALLIEGVNELIKKDAENFSSGLFDLSLIEIEKPVKHIKNLAKIYIDSVGVVFNKKNKKHKVFSKESKSKTAKLPDYYNRNFHNQTDGYLSENSAELYNHQVDILFRGTSDAMRRLMVEAFKKFYSGSDKLKIVEVACGTGISTRPLALSFKDSLIKAFDISKDYVGYAKKNKPFPNVVYATSPGEDLKDVESGSVDAWCSTFLFHELPKDVRINVLKEAYRVLKPGGRVFVLDSIQEHDRPDLKPLLDEFPLNFHEPYYKNYVIHSLEDIFKDLKFNNVDSFHRSSSKVVYGTKPMSVKKSVTKKTSKKAITGKKALKKKVRVSKASTKK